MRAVSDDDAIRRAARRIAVRTGVVFAVALVGLAALAAVLMLRTQQSDDERLLRQAIADSDAVTDPPSGIYIYESDGGTPRVTTGLPGITATAPVSLDGNWTTTPPNNGAAYGPVDATHPPIARTPGLYTSTVNANVGTRPGRQYGAGCACAVLAISATVAASASATLAC